MATYPRVPTQNNQQYTLDSQLAAGGTTATLNQSVTGIVQAPGYFVADRVDSSGTSTPTKREYIYFTGVSGANLTGLVRGQASSTDQVHAVAAIVEFVPNVSDEEDKYSVFTQEHSVNGVHINLASLASTSFPGRINPVWYLPALQSGPSVGIGRPLKMPASGTINWVAMTLYSAISSASLIIDIKKNGTSIFDSGTRPSILGGGTFVSTASIATKAFIQSNEMTVDLANGGNAVDAMVQFSAR